MSSISVPDYRIEVSARAKQVWLKVLRSREVVVVVPRGFDQCRVAELVASKRLWLVRKLAELGSEPLSSEPKLPTTLELRAFSEQWRVVYHLEESSRPKLEVVEEHSLLVVSGPSEALEALPLLRGWLILRAKQQLMPQLDRLASENRLVYQQGRIRWQKSRYGSCSTLGNINLNAKLLFLPPELVRYVILHELCHTLEMNHSVAFWELLAGYERRGRQLDRQLRRQGVLFLPEWSRFC